MNLTKSQFKAMNQTQGKFNKDGEENKEDDQVITSPEQLQEITPQNVGVNHRNCKQILTKWQITLKSYK